MANVYFVRHAQPNFDNHDDLTRELSPKGLRDAVRVTEFFADIRIDAVYSSPFRRAVDTVRGVAQARGLDIGLIDDLRERRVDGGWIEDFDSFARRQWSDFDYRLPGGESLGQVQRRSVAALERLTADNPGRNIVIGSHGTSLSTIINHYDPGFGYADFLEIQNRMPWIVLLIFDENGYVKRSSLM